MLPPSHLPQRLRDIGFSYDPFAWPHAEKMHLDVLEETYTAHPKFDNTIMNLSQSSVLLAQSGGGKTAGRLRLTSFLLKQQEHEAAKHLAKKLDVPTIPLVVQYDDFEGIMGKLPDISIEHHIPLLLPKIADSIFEFIISHQELYTDLTIQDQNFWWTFIDNYKLGESLDYSIKNEQLLNDWKRNTGNPSPIIENTGLAEILKILIGKLKSLMVDSLFILVDGVDAQLQEKNIIEPIPSPLLNHLGLFSVNGVIWKFFLPLDLYETVRKSNIYQRSGLEVVTIEWDKKSIVQFLSNRLLWASEGKISNVTLQCSQELITKLSKVDIDAVAKDDVDTTLAEMSLRHTRFGPPRALLQITDKLYLQGNQPQISIDDWDKFTLEIQDELYKGSYVRDIYESIIIGILDDDTGKAMGTAFITRHGNRNFIVTCAHVIKELNKHENDNIRLSRMESSTEFQGKIIWYRPSEIKSDHDWSALEDVCVIEASTDLSATEQLPLKAIDKDKYISLSNCWCFGYLIGTGSRGASFEKISCKETLQGADFVELEQTGKDRIGTGVSGAPLYSPDVPGIIGIIQSIRGSDIAYLIPSYVIHNILETIIRSSITGGTI